jgi:Glutathionylspermidine synthase preATP-grasp
VRKPLYSREGAVALVTEGVTLVEQQGPYGAEGFIRQAYASLPNFSGQYPVIGSWLIDHVSMDSCLVRRGTRLRFQRTLVMLRSGRCGRCPDRWIPSWPDVPDDERDPESISRFGRVPQK